MRQYRKLNNSPKKRSKTNECLKKYREINASPDKGLRQMSTKENIDKDIKHLWNLQ